MYAGLSSVRKLKMVNSSSGFKISKKPRHMKVFDANIYND